MALPDTRACWPVAASVTVFVFFGTMLVRSEAIMYVGFMDMLQVNREKASWPLTVAIIMSQLAGPLYGLLGIWLSDRILMVAGALLCALPVMACAFTQSFGLVVFLYGVLFGLGLACVDLVPYTVVVRHFVRYRATVMGSVFVVAALSGFVFPLMVEALRNAFQFHYVLLILGALELVMLVGCIVVDRVPRSDDGSSRSSGCAEPATEPPVAFGCTNSLEKACIAKSFTKEIVPSLAVTGSHAETEEPCETNPLLGKLQPVKRKLTRNLRSLASWAFLHVAVSRAVSFFVITSFLLTAVDFGTDNGLVSFEAVALVTACAVGDLVSKIGIGFVLDAKVLSHEALILCGFAIQAASLVVTVLVKKYWVLLVSCFFTGLTGGSRIFACTVMVAELFDQQSLPLGLGVTNFVAGIVSLARPPLVGYARDVGGSYDLLYVALAIVNGVFTLTWTISLCWRRFQRLRQKEPPTGLSDENDQGVPQG
ncbi:monocarboxylate transporter 12-like [Dermacentor silvarum]|uniref:monocarboxylate transporter 12-like n=1 Tax=Dermacentor silvarum TaxID=543639 RepID=UPI00189BF143|nr:monocarboxylate transporter 12-like [Dermacentor silvarum]